MLLLSDFLKRDILKELYREKRITAEEYLTRLKRVFIVAGFFMILGFTLMDYFTIPRFWDSYVPLGLPWSALIALGFISFLFLLARRDAKATIVEYEKDAKSKSNQFDRSL